MAHVPRLTNAGGNCDTGYCAVCQRYLRRNRRARGDEERLAAGPWVAVWSGSAVCTGPPLVVA